MVHDATDASASEVTSRLKLSGQAVFRKVLRPLRSEPSPRSGTTVVPSSKRLVKWLSPLSVAGSPGFHSEPVDGPTALVRGVTKQTTRPYSVLGLLPAKADVGAGALPPEA